ncbi:hypothetical protein KDAU_71330 [Dictyobacter aurantiacus]|uniref:Uncharacterized protein n=1 Tax=Dictyobacter aurantiacus TaxID=1936993 RepID=A0A401ZSP4_9CHLR|nr:hypothetical protein KDAU_71330 [Dictyobacter aurantiacus]
MEKVVHVMREFEVPGTCRHKSTGSRHRMGYFYYLTESDNPGRVILLAIM